MQPKKRVVTLAAEALGLFPDGRGGPILDLSGLPEWTPEQQQAVRRVTRAGLAAMQVETEQLMKETRAVGLRVEDVKHVPAWQLRPMIRRRATVLTRPHGRAPRQAANTRHRGSRRTTGSGATSSGEDDPGESEPPPRRHLLEPRYRLRLRDGRRLDAAQVEHLPCGWLRAKTIRTRIVFDEDENLGRRVFDGLRVRRYPPSSIIEVVELEGVER